MLRIAVSAKAVLDLRIPCEVYRTQGQAAFDKLMANNLVETLPEGPMLPLIRAFQATGLVEISLLSKISPESGKRIRRSLEEHDITIPNQTYTNGPGAFQQARGLHAYLSCDEKDVKEAVEQGIPAAYLLPAPRNQAPIQELRIALDFDGFIASDEAETITVTQGLKAFQEHEEAKQNHPLRPGPFTPFAIALSNLRKKCLENPEGMQVKLALVTARGQNESIRARTTLREWGIELDSYYFLGGKAKAEAVKEFGSQLFFDDSRKHCDNVSEHVLSGHAIYGISNQHFVPPTKSPLTYMLKSPVTQPSNASPGESLPCSTSQSHQNSF